MPVPDEASTLDAIEAETYYDVWHDRDTLTVPVELASLLDAFAALDNDDKERFLRACYWYHMAGTVWDYSQSLYLTSFINAVECLASVGRERLDPEGAVKLFKRFMRRYAPGSPSGTKLDKLYEIRSDITHGERLLHLDQPPGATALSQDFAIALQAGDDAAVLTRGALLNWLWEHHPSASGLLLTQGMKATKPAKPGTKSEAKIVVPGRTKRN
jgi:hypothetical protein